MKALALRPTTFELKTAAKLLGITHHALTSELRDRGVLMPTEYGLVPTAAHEKTGHFIREPRSTIVEGSFGRRPRHYVVTLVTLQGLAWLADELRRAA